MRFLLTLALSIMSLVATAPQSAAAAEVKRFQQPEFKVAFDYPAEWTLASSEPRGVLPNELFQVRASGTPTTAFALAVYRLDAVVTLENIDAMLEQIDRRVAAWVAALPSGNLVEVYDVVVDTAEGREFVYTFEHDGQVLQADMIIALNEDRAFEVSQWAAKSEYDARLAAFDEIFSSLVLPFTPGA